MKVAWQATRLVQWAQNMDGSLAKLTQQQLFPTKYFLGYSTKHFSTYTKNGQKHQRQNTPLTMKRYRTRNNRKTENTTKRKHQQLLLAYSQIGVHMLKGRDGDVERKVSDFN